jgi:hypothetical protein
MTEPQPQGAGRLEVPGTLRIPVAVLAERRPGVTRWAEWAWRAVEVLEAAPELPPWTLLREDAGRSLFFAGTAEVALYPTDTPNYRDNLAAAAPRIWVVLRPVPQQPGMALHAVTVDTGEAHVYAESGADLLESLPLPPGLQATMEAFIARHHVERAFHKRRRDRADPDTLGKRPGGRRSGEAE